MSAVADNSVRLRLNDVGLCPNDVFASQIIMEQRPPQAALFHYIIQSRKATLYLNFSHSENIVCP